MFNATRTQVLNQCNPNLNQELGWWEDTLPRERSIKMVAKSHNGISPMKSKRKADRLSAYLHSRLCPSSIKPIRHGVAGAAKVSVVPFVE